MPRRSEIWEDAKSNLYAVARKMLAAADDRDLMRNKAEFVAQTFEKLEKVLPQGAELYVEHVLVSGNWAVVELHSKATAKNGFKFDNRYCWICRFVNGTIVEVRAYLDSTLVARLFEENPI